MIRKITLPEYYKLIAGYDRMLMRAAKLALIESLNLGEGEAKQKVVEQFPGRRGYTPSGNLLNSIYNRVEETGKGIAGYIGSTSPYARAHEEGLEIKTKNAKFLWVRTRDTLEKGSPYRRLTPTEFYYREKEIGSDYYYKGLGAYIFPERARYPLKLFILRKRVKMPKRQFLYPGARKAIDHMPAALNMWLDKLAEPNKV